MNSKKTLLIIFGGQEPTEGTKTAKKIGLKMIVCDDNFKAVLKK